MLLIVALVAVAAVLVGWLVVDGRRRGRPGRLVAAAAIDLFVGYAASSLAIAHVIAVIAVAVRRGGHVFVWDFRFASLLLLGVAITAAGLQCLVVARALTRRSVAAWRHALVGSATLLVINAPLMPVQAFAVMLGVLAAANVVNLLVARPRLAY